MKAEILAVGTELLLGDIVNTNAQYLSKKLASMGFSLYHQSVIGDNEDRLRNALALAFSRSDLVITTGGLGPTKDDLTKEVCANFMNKELYLHEESLNEIKTYFNKMNRNMTDSNIKQAYLPKGSTILKNNHGTAPGCIIDDNGKVLILLPGPPREMKPMFEDYAVPYLKKYQDGLIISRVLRILGIGEGEMAEKLGAIIDQSNPTVSPYAKDTEVTLRITAKATTEAEARTFIESTEKNIREILGEHIYGVDDDTIEEVVCRKLKDRGLTLSTAESCTGGMIASRLINCPGVSAVFMEGAVTYSNEAKISRLGVKKETLEKLGAVSEKTASEMAEGMARSTGTNVAISVTGIAGPEGGTEDKPVGLVYIGLCINGVTQVKKFNFVGNREKIRTRTTITALDWLRREL